MRMYLISDNTDTLTGMRLAGVDGVIANEKGTLEKALNEVLKDKNIGIILLTEALGKKYPELVKTVRTEHKKPLLIEIPDRHGTGRRPDFITAYVNDAIRTKVIVCTQRFRPQATAIRNRCRSILESRRWLL